MLTTYLSKLPNLIIALLVLLIGWGIAKIIEKAVYKGLQKQKSTTGSLPKKSRRAIPQKKSSVKSFILSH